MFNNVISIVLSLTISLIVIFVLTSIIDNTNHKSLKNVCRKLTYTHNIPRIIFRTYYTRNVEDVFYEYCYKPWKMLNSKYTMIWYIDKDCRNMMRKIGERYYNAYNKIIPGAYKADLWRACILYEHGGVYTDSYTIPYCSLNLMLSKCWKNGSANYFISVKDRSVDPETNTHGIHNGFMICTPRHPFMKQYIKDIITNIENSYYGPDPLSPTGPFCLKKSINKTIGLKQQIDFKEGYNDFKDLSFYLFRLGTDAYQCIYNEDEICIMQKKHSMITYFYDKIIKKSYKTLWRNRKIYN